MEAPTQRAAQSAVYPSFYHAEGGRVLRVGDLESYLQYSHHCYTSPKDNFLSRERIQVEPTVTLPLRDDLALSPHKRRRPPPPSTFKQGEWIASYQASMQLCAAPLVVGRRGAQFSSSHVASIFYWCMFFCIHFGHDHSVISREA